MKWPESKRQCNISIIELKDFTRNEYLEGDNGEFVPIVAFECRGCDIVDFNLKTLSQLKAKVDLFLKMLNWKMVNVEYDKEMIVRYDHQCRIKDRVYSGKGGKGARKKKRN